MVYGHDLPAGSHREQMERELEDARECGFILPAPGERSAWEEGESEDNWPGDSLDPTAVGLWCLLFVTVAAVVVSLMTLGLVKLLTEVSS